MPRRIAAMFAIVLLLGLLFLLVWRVYRQHEEMHEPDEAAVSNVVRLDKSAATSVEKFALLIA